MTSIDVAVQYGDPRLPDRFWIKVYPCPITGCWFWGTGTRTYGSFYWKRRNKGAHVVSYKVLTGRRVRKGRHVDHLCCQTLCVNPAHLEAVSLVTNVMRGNSPVACNARKSACHKGHQLVQRKSPSGRVWRICLICNRDHKRAKRAAALGVPVETIGAPRLVCKRNHPLIGPGANVYVDPAGKRTCRSCRLIRRRTRGGYQGRGRSQDRTHCPRSHPYNEDNTRWYQGRRYCRACGRAGGRSVPIKLTGVNVAQS